jgi:hypothetical protein
MLEVESICLFVLDCDNAMGVYDDIVETKVVKGVDNVAEFVVEKGGLVAINGGRRGGGINGRKVVKLLPSQEATSQRLE